MRNITSGLEDYLEKIYIANINNKPLKGAELARSLNISRASVSEALSRLVAQNLIIYNSYETIQLTNQGLEEAKKVYEKHNTLKKFFELVLNISPNEASDNACKIEHVISQNILNQIAEYITFYEKNKTTLDKLRKEN